MNFERILNRILIGILEGFSNGYLNGILDEMWDCLDGVLPPEYNLVIWILGYNIKCNLKQNP